MFRVSPRETKAMTGSPTCLATALFFLHKHSQYLFQSPEDTMCDAFKM